jgi:hypothetical protein
MAGVRVGDWARGVCVGKRARGEEREGMVDVVGVNLSIVAWNGHHYVLSPTATVVPYTSLSVDIRRFIQTQLGQMKNLREGTEKSCPVPPRGSSR